MLWRAGEVLRGRRGTARLAGLVGKGARELSQKVRATAPGAWPPPDACPTASTPRLTDPAQEGSLCPPVLCSSSQPGPWASGSPTVEWRRQHEKGLWKMLGDTDRADPRRHSAPQPACDTDVPERTEQVPGVCRPPPLPLPRGASAWEPSPCVYVTPPAPALQTAWPGLQRTQEPRVPGTKLQTHIGVQVCLLNREPVRHIFPGSSPF